MPGKGYWVECIPVNGNANQNMSPDLYSATIGSFPEVSAYAPSPDEAIRALRDKLQQTKQQYESSGRTLPDTDNPVRPPNRLRFVQGWMSVYIDMSEVGG